MCFYNKLVHLLILFFLVGLNINFSGIKASYNGDICTTEQNVEFSDCFEHCFNHFSEKDINAEVKDGVLCVKASLSNTVDSSSFIHRGIAERSFSRQFRLADNIEVTNAELVNGMLIISLHRNIPEAELPKKIEIKTPTRKILSKKAA